MQRPDHRLTVVTSWWQRAPRLLIALVIAVASVGLIGNAPSHAQGSALLSPSTVTPDTALFYAEVSLDTSNAQLQQLDALARRLGAEESLIDALNESASDTGNEVDLTGSEVAVAILPQALESAGGDPADLVEAASSGDLPEDVANASAGSDTEGIVLIVRPPDIAQFEAQARESEGVPTDTETYSGAEIVTYDDDDGDASSYVFEGDFAFAGSTADDLKPFIDAVRGEAGTLSEVEGFQTASELLPQERVAFAFSNGPALFSAVEEAAEGEPLAADVLAMLDTYSAFSGLVLSAAEEGVRVDSVMVPEDGSAAATASGSAADLALAERMPADTVVFASGFDLGQSAFLNLLGLGLIAAATSGLSDFDSGDDAASPTPVSVEDMYEQIEMMLGFNLQTDFIDQLSGPYAFGVWNADEDLPSAALVSGVTDATEIGDTVSTISTLIQAAGQGEVNVTSLSVSGGAVDHVEFESDGMTIAIDYGVIGEEFVLSLGGGAETVMNGPEETLADSETFTNTLSLLPDEYQAVYYVDIAALESATGMSAREIAEQQGELISDLLAATPEAGAETVPEAFAAATYVQDGYYFTSGILVVP